MIRSIDLELILPPTSDCEQLANQIDRLVTNEVYWSKQLNESELQATKTYLQKKRKEYSENDCLKKISQKKGQTISLVSGTFSAEDKSRIENVTTKNVNNRLFLGISILLSGLIIIAIFGEKK